MPAPTRNNQNDNGELPTPVAALIGALVVGTVILTTLSLLLSQISSLSTNEDAPTTTTNTETQKQTEPARPQLDMRGFNVGNLISDEEFFNAQAMNEEEIADFITTWNAGCHTGPDGTACLSDYRENTPTWPADQYCPRSFDGQPAMAASSIIYQVAQACEINPAVLLTTLQKEQGLITASGTTLTASRYQSAMGYACPDGNNCDPKWQGFTRQIYGAAHQFQRYRLEPEEYAIKAGQLNDIAYNVAKECGTAPVYVENQATAGLYNYTPYQPTPATVNGQNEPCSTWGNRNFYGLYQAWFRTD